MALRRTYLTGQIGTSAYANTDWGATAKHGATTVSPDTSQSRQYRVRALAFRSGHHAQVTSVVDHLVVGSADLDLGAEWIADRLAVRPVFGGVHEGFGTRNALVGLGDQYLEVLALDPDQAGTPSSLSRQVASLSTPRLMTVAIARSGLKNGVPMSRVRPDGVHLDWELEFTSTPLFFIDWKGCPRPTGLPHGGFISSLAITTPDPASLADVAGITVHEGAWSVEAHIDGKPLA